MKALVELRKATAMKEGYGADVKRLMPVGGFMNFDPFVLWDHFDVRPGCGFPDHPHRGFEAITYIFEGAMNHTDNLGNSSTVTSGGAQRFTAGSGLIHSETPSPEGSTSGIQLWINLPESQKMIEPSCQQVDSRFIQELDMGGVRIRTIVGLGSSLKLHTELAYEDVSLKKGSRYQNAFSHQFRGFVYTVEGLANVNGIATPSGSALFSDRMDKLDISTDDGCHFMVCAGVPWGEPIHQHGPYVD